MTGPALPPLSDDELPAHADVLVVGAGHNGLTCAAYLARAGRRVVVVEARDTVGGCASTVDAIGARVNICNCDHTMVLASGIVEDLDLAAHGLSYLDIDPMQVAVGWGDEPVFVQWRDVERTIAGLAAVDRRAAVAYRRYVDAVLPVARLVLAATSTRPAAAPLLAMVLRRGGRGAATLLAWRRRSLLDVLGSFGLPPWIQAAMATTGPAVWGLAPDTPGTGIGALGAVTRHLVGVGRPAGGSGALPVALASVVTAHGGTVHTGRRVADLVTGDGKVRGVRLADGSTLTADVVVAAVDPGTLLPPSDSWPVRDGYESKVDAVVTAPPPFTAFDRLPDDVPRHLATTVVSPPPGRQVHSGRVSDPPMFLVNVPSVADPSMRSPAGDHLLSLEVLWTPYGRVAPEHPARWLARLAELCEPGWLDTVGERRAMTPADYEREFGLARGYAPSFPGGPLAALLGRHRSLTRYRTPVRGLYLTGAATFPGAGVWGASGRNTAATVLQHTD